VDFLSVLNDTALQSGISDALQTALNDLKTALGKVISCKMEDTKQLGTGLTVMSSITMNQNEKTISDLYQYQAMTDAGSGAWTQFTLKLQDTAKVTGQVYQLPDGALSFDVPDNGSCTVTVNDAENARTVEAYPHFLGTFGKTSGLIFDHLQYTHKTEAQWYSFYVSNTKGAKTSNLKLDFSHLYDEQTLAAGLFTVSIYKQDENKKYTQLVHTFQNEADDSYVDIDLASLKLAENTEYAFRVYSASATAEYSMTYTLKDASDNEIKAASADLLDDTHKEKKDRNNSADTACHLTGNYYSGMIVYADEKDAEQKTVSHSDWYYSGWSDCVITVKVYGGNTDLLETSPVNVEKYRYNSETKVETLISSATGEKKEAGGYWEYTFSHFGLVDENDYSYLKISTAVANDPNFYYYNITVQNRQSGCTAIISTDVYKSAETGRSTLCWEANAQSNKNTLQLSADDFEETALTCTVKTFTAQIYNSNSDLYWRIGNEKNEEWFEDTKKIDADADGTVAKQVVAANDYVSDILLAHTNGTWGTLYSAHHVGFANGWTGTGEYVSINGKNKISDTFSGGGSDSAMLFLTDDDGEEGKGSGDALFVDDIYSAFGDSARVAKLTDVFAGAGNDVLDFTSQRYAYAASESKLTLHGGDGDDVIWGANTASRLFGDAGDDRIVGGSGDDLIVGGSGNNTLHGGGGNDIFCFYNNKTTQEANTVTQLEDGSVILWFDDKVDGEWNAETLTFSYNKTDENKSTVVVKGVTNDKISIRIGNHDFNDTAVKYAAEYAALTEENAFAASSSTTI